MRERGRSPKDLLREIQAFEARMRSYEYTVGWGWDAEIREERAWGDESWAEEINEFLSGARDLYDAGEYAGARDVYEAALRVYEEGLEEGLLAGADPDALLEADLDEECARYLRCVYLVTEAPARPEALMDAWAAPFVRHGAMNLRAMLEVDEAELPDWGAFGKEWIEYLDRMAPSGRVTEWTREAVRLFRGTEGLEELARSRGKDRPSYFIEWVDALRTEGRIQEAVDAAVLGLDTVPDGLRIRAELAERLVACARTMGRESEVDRGLREALWAEPNLPRLVAYVERGATFVDRQERLDRVADRFADLDRGARKAPVNGDPETRHGSVPPRLWPCVHLLRGDFEALARISWEAKPLGWHYGDNPASVAIPFLLYSCRGTARKRLPANLRQEWEDALFRVGAHWLGGWDPGGDRFEGEEEEAAGPGTDVPERFTRLAHEAIAAADAADADLRRWLGVAEKAALKRVDTIVSNKKRGSYDKAAQLLAAVAEAYWTWGEPDEGERLLTRYWTKYSRFYAFRRELKAAVVRGPLKPAWV
ncbi:MAG: hypothetical protein D6708_07735 [Candidatus Dadabacteria bacterium]|nr:MAG: hypothetical protein D6708_07735 [Candidatus Dadabacteria bacterium]